MPLIILVLLFPHHIAYGRMWRAGLSNLCVGHAQCGTAVRSVGFEWDMPCYVLALQEFPVLLQTPTPLTSNTKRTDTQLEHQDLKNKGRLHVIKQTAHGCVMPRNGAAWVSFTACNSTCCLDLMVCSVGVGEAAAGFFFWNQQYSLIVLKN